MKKLGNEIFVQRGEKWTLDFEVRNEDGDPFVVLSSMKNPYCLITVTNADYSQQEEFRESYWLNLNELYKEAADKILIPESIKKFQVSESLLLSEFSATEAYTKYKDKYGMTANYEFAKRGIRDVSNFLYAVKNEITCEVIYKYLSSYSYDEVANKFLSETWKDYKFQAMYTFETKDWTAQNYLLDIKIVSGQTLRENLIAYLRDRNITTPINADIEQMIELVDDEKDKEFYTLFYLSGQPIMNNYDTNIVVLEPIKLTVSTNIQRG